jgi:co-chaperonin GroES (HSP10)
MTEYENELKEAFPEVDPGIRPFGSRVLVQIKTPKTKTKSGLFLGNDLVETEKWNTQTAKVISLGPLAFKNRDTMKAWPEGDWCKPGDFVRVGKYGGDRFEVPFEKDSDDCALFVVFNDLDIIGDVYSNPLEIKAFL